MALQLRDGTEHMAGECGVQREQLPSPTTEIALRAPVWTVGTGHWKAEGRMATSIQA